MPANESLRNNRLFNSNAILDTCRKDLIDIFDSIRGKKSLFLDSTLSGPVSQIADFSLLQSHGVDKIFVLTSPTPTKVIIDTKSVLFLSRPLLENVQSIVSYIRVLQQAGSFDYEFRIVVVPRKTNLFERIFEEEGLLNNITVSTLELGLLPLEDDVLSLELPLESSYKGLFLDRDHNCLWEIAKSLRVLESRYGNFHRILCKGDNAVIVANMLRKMKKEDDSSDFSLDRKNSLTQNVPENDFVIDSLVLIDRSVDPITPLCTQLTYEGLIDEVFHIQNSNIEIDKSLLSESNDSTNATKLVGAKSANGGTFSTVQRKKKIMLTNKDPLYRHLRDFNFSAAGSYLHHIARSVKETYESRHKASNISQVRDFFQLLPALQSQHASLKLHTVIAEQLRNYTLEDDFDKTLQIQQNLLACTEDQSHVEMIQEFIHRRLPLKTVLRLCCLWSLVSGGIKPKVFDLIRRDIVQTYGFKCLVVLESLRRIGLFTRKGSAAGIVLGGSEMISSNSSIPSSKPFALVSKNPFPVICKGLKLIIDDVDERSPTDISYVYSGYAPISIRLVSYACQKRGSRNTNKSFLTSLQSSLSPMNIFDCACPSEFNAWSGMEDLLKLLPGPTLDECITTASDMPGGDTNTHVQLRHGEQKQKYTVVFFVGGCTFTEISALRFLSNGSMLASVSNEQESNINRRYLIATTGILNGNALMDSLLS
jgi:hypothetical protein